MSTRASVIPEIPREQFTRSILVANITRMSITCHEEIGRVRNVSDEDVTRMLASCPQQVVSVVLVELEERHDTRTNEHLSRPPADQLGKRTAS